MAGARKEDFNGTREDSPHRAKLSWHHQTWGVQNWHHAGTRITISVFLYDLDLCLFVANVVALALARVI